MKTIDVTTNNCFIDIKVVRGRNWIHGNQDGFPGNIGIVTNDNYSGSGGDTWVWVEWGGKKGSNAYRIGPNKFDLLMYDGKICEIYELW